MAVILNYNIKEGEIMSKTFVFDIETSGLDPKDSEIYCIYLLDSESDVHFLNYSLAKTTKVGQRISQEEYVIKSFFETLKNEDITKLVGFNNILFDAKFITKRAALYNIFIEDFIKIEQVDVRIILNPDPYARGTLHDYARRFKISYSDGMIGSKVREAYENGKHDLIAMHCMEDVKITKQLYNLVRT
jgi:predicted PolB exonuclease-like 3'-5' exonuclease